MASGLLSLKWNQHRSTFLNSLANIKQKELYSDITLACDGKYYEAHRLVLSACSEFFEGLFERTKCKHPIVVLKDVSSEDLESLLSYMYDGEVNVLQENLSCLIKAAECLKIKGLAVPDTEPKDKVSNISKSHKNSSNVNNSNSQQSDNSSSVRNYKSSFSSSSGVKRPNNFSNSDSNFKKLEEIQPSKKRKPEVSEDNDSIYEPSENEKLPLDAEKESQPTPDETLNNNNTFAEEISKETGVKAEPIEVIDDDIEDVTDAQESNDQHDYDGINNDEDFTSEEKYIQHEEDTNSLWGNLENDSNDMYGQASTSYGGDENNGKPGTSSASVEEQNPMRMHLSPGSQYSLNTSSVGYTNSFIDTSLSKSSLIGFPVSNFYLSNESNSGDSENCFLECPECPFKTFSAKSFIQHSKGHAAVETGSDSNFLHCLTSPNESEDTDRPYVCNVCGKRFGRKTHLNTHLVIHSGEKPFKCPYCPYGATQKGNLKIHVQNHTGLKPFVCKFCSYKSTQRIGLRLHIINNHPQHKEEILNV